MENHVCAETVCEYNCMDYNCTHYQVRCLNTRRLLPFLRSGYYKQRYKLHRNAIFRCDEHICPVEVKIGNMEIRCNYPAVIPSGLCKNHNMELLDLYDSDDD